MRERVRSFLHSLIETCVWGGTDLLSVVFQLKAIQHYFPVVLSFLNTKLNLGYLYF